VARGSPIKEAGSPTVPEPLRSMQSQVIAAQDHVCGQPSNRLLAVGIAAHAAAEVSCASASKKLEVADLAQLPNFPPVYNDDPICLHRPHTFCGSRRGISSRRSTCRLAALNCGPAGNYSAPV
jgi:hypothetical protein